MDTEAFKKRFLPYNKKLYCIAFRLLGNVADAEDALQDTYVKLWENRDKLEDLLNPEAYCTVLLRNKCLDMLKSANNKNDSFDLNYDESDEHTIISKIEEKENMSNLWQIIRKLPEQQRKIIILRHIKGCTFEEIENLTGLSAINVRVSLSRGRKAIREKFEEINRQEFKIIQSHKS